MGVLKILATNDDGYLALGLNALVKALGDFAQVEVVAPEQNSSGMSSCLTLTRPLYVTQASEHIRFINGTPADCVHLCLSGLLDFKPDLVVSGVNNGANMGDDTLYSGTVAAAMAGYLHDIPSIAFSCVKMGWEHVDTTVQVACDLIKELLEKQLIGEQAPKRPWLLNVNVPNVAYEQLQGREITRLGRRQFGNSLIRSKNPYGHEMFWHGFVGNVKQSEPGTDFYATEKGRVSITPLQSDLTYESTRKDWMSIV